MILDGDASGKDDVTGMHRAEGAIRTLVAVRERKENEDAHVTNGTDIR
jgi:hypothetical protein